jgi:hypothetical protein
MPTPQERDDLSFISDLMREAVGVMESFPADFVPPDETRPGVERFPFPGYEVILADSQFEAWLREVTAPWPKRLLPIFVEASAYLAQILEAFIDRTEARLLDIFATASRDPGSMELLMALAQIRRELKESSDDAQGSGKSDPTGMEAAMLDELHRRGAALRIPFARTLTTLLGMDALLWLVAKSQEGHGKLQPHEFSRTGWRNLQAIATQVAIERELIGLDPRAQSLGKMAVALAWTMVALACYMPPGIFIGESVPYLSSARGGGFTVSSGVGTHTLVEFDPAAMRPLVRILAEGLVNPLLSAADLMWASAGMVRVRRAHHGLEEATSPDEERFSLFLSHRGRDAKRDLWEVVRALPASHGVFLDCLTLPRGVINRSFVYGSLMRTQRILIVETEHYHESDWCRKEAWFADALAAHGLVKTERLSLPEAQVRVALEGRATWRVSAQRGLAYTIGPRVLSDMDYFGRAPNLYSLKEAGHPTDSLAAVQAALDTKPDPDDANWVRSVGEAVTTTLSRVVAVAPDAEPFDLWATAAQYALAAFGSTSEARSKVEVRQGVDRLNSALRAVVGDKLFRSPIFQAQAPRYLAMIAAATALDLSGFDLDPRLTPVLRLAVGDVASLRDGVLLLDVRPRGALRDFRLRLAALLVEGDLGSVGIVQDAADEVHQNWIDDLPLDVLPCVTLHPGMDVPFFPDDARLA